MAFGGTSIVEYSGNCHFGDGAYSTGGSCVPMFGVYVANTDGSAHNLIDFGGNPDWFVSSPGRPLAAFTHQCSGSACQFDGSGSSDADGTIASPHLAIWRWEPRFRTDAPSRVCDWRSVSRHVDGHG